MPRLPGNTHASRPQRGGLSERWILASRSPRRSALLRAGGQCFDVIGSDVEEIAIDGEDAEAFARRMAREKATDVARREPDRWILGADTIVVVDELVLGKPADDEEARRMLARLSGTRHQVLTAFVLIAPNGTVVADEVVRSTVVFRPLSSDEIDGYVATGESLDKAGAYAIQGGARAFVREVEGSWSNVVGLPLEAVEASLRREGLWQEPTG